jgi:cation diffusion facilitator CzcD-associated flavoprotein CzcO
MGEPNQRIVIVGSGFSGLAMGIRLKQAGIHDFVILERANDVGGTWRDNTYPGAACDVQSHLYSFSFEPNPRWSRMFAPQAEILAYLRSCADKYGLYPHIRFGATVTRAELDERAGLWQIASSDGRTERARVLVAGCGALSRPSLPDIAGVSSFEGKAFHTARWDDTYPLDGKTVGVIGTGASAIQIVPSIAARVRKLHVFQRTPPWILPKPDREMSAREKNLFDRAPFLQDMLRIGIYWQREALALGFVTDPRIMKIAETMARRHLEKSVPDPVLRGKLTPDYTIGCKRVIPTNDYYPALLRDNVELVTSGIDRIRARGIVTKDGIERTLDAIVLATGFQAAEAVAPFEIIGRSGRDLATVWRDGAEAYLGTTVTGFPNFFMMVGPNVLLGHSSMVFMIESQAEYILSSIHAMRANRWKLVDVREDAQAKYNARLGARLANTVWATGCKSWYQTRTGKNTTLWPGFTWEFRMRTRRFDPPDYEVVTE